MSSSAEVVFSTSFDDKYPPNNALSSNNSMFWSTTGLYPQEVVLSLPQAKSISEVVIVGYNIKKISIESCENDSAVKFNSQSEVSNIPQQGLQSIQCKFNSKSANKIVKVIIQEGYGNFCTINSINIK